MINLSVVFQKTLGIILIFLIFLQVSQKENPDKPWRELIGAIGGHLIGNLISRFPLVFC